MITTEVIDRIIGADALDVQDDRIGEVAQIYIDERTDRPTWVSVRLGLLSGAEVLVPLENAEWDEHSLHVDVERRLAREAPRKEMDEPLTVGEEERLYTHYGIPAVRHQRGDADLLDADTSDVCYSVRETDAPEPSLTAADWPELSRAS
ncbi:MAG: PRC-barrel domain containing protein [Acidobacteria bacterium]|nr:PRC-barrel domain containing protein [Acidobacteriota bacterium]